MTAAAAVEKPIIELFQVLCPACFRKLPKEQRAQYLITTAHGCFEFEEKLEQVQLLEPKLRMLNVTRTVYKQVWSHTLMPKRMMYCSKHRDVGIKHGDVGIKHRDVGIKHCSSSSKPEEDSVPTNVNHVYVLKPKLVASVTYWKTRLLYKKMTS